MHASKKMGMSRGIIGKQAVLGIRGHRGAGEMRAVPVDSESGATEGAKLPVTVKQGAGAFTDDHLAYRHIDKRPYTHRSVKHSERVFASEISTFPYESPKFYPNSQINGGKVRTELLSWILDIGWIIAIGAWLANEQEKDCEKWVGGIRSGEYR